MLYLLVGILLLANLLLATVFLNYKKLINKRVTKYERNVKQFFRDLFAKIDEEDQGWISVEKMTEVLGGDQIVARDKRLNDLLWQSSIILGGQIGVQDFAFILHYTETP